MGAVVPKSGPDPWQNFQVFQKYKFTKNKLGIGQACQVHHAVENSLGGGFAVKIIVKEEAQLLGHKDTWRNEAEMMERLHHPNICAFHESFEDKDLLYFVFELCEGGTLFEKLERDVVLEESAARKLCKGMFSAVAHCHDKGIIHRDLRPESWLLSDLSGDADLKLSKFKMAADCAKDHSLSTPCGTLHYVAPEVLRGQYGRPSDNWTLGVLLFLMVYGSYPFDGDSCSVVMTNIMTSEPDWCNSCYSLSSDLRDLLKNLLNKNPEKRLTVEQGLRHKWLPPGGKTNGRRNSLVDMVIGLRGGRKNSRCNANTYTRPPPVAAIGEIQPPPSDAPELKAMAPGERRRSSLAPELKAMAPGERRRSSFLVTDELLQNLAVQALNQQILANRLGVNMIHEDEPAGISPRSGESDSMSSPLCTLGVVPSPWK